MSMKNLFYFSQMQKHINSNLVLPFKKVEMEYSLYNSNKVMMASASRLLFVRNVLICFHLVAEWCHCQEL